MQSSQQPLPEGMGRMRVSDFSGKGVIFRYQFRAREVTKMDIFFSPRKIKKKGVRLGQRHYALDMLDIFITLITILMHSVSSLVTSKVNRNYWNFSFASPAFKSNSHVLPVTMRLEILQFLEQQKPFLCLALWFCWLNICFIALYPGNGRLSSFSVLR